MRATLKGFIDFKYIFVTNHLPPQNIVFFEKLPVPQPVKKLPSLYRTRMSLPCAEEPVTCPCPEPHQSSPRHPHSISLKSILILFYHIRLSFPSGPSASGPPPPKKKKKNRYTFAFSRICATGRNVQEKIKPLKRNPSIRLEKLENSYPVTMRHIAERMLHGG